MKRMFRLSLTAGVAFFLLRLSTFVVPEAICICLAGLLGLTLLGFLVMSAMTGFTSWRTTSKLWAAPAVICVASIALGILVPPSIGQYIADSVHNKDLNTYSRIVEDFKKGAIACTSPCNGNLELVQVVSQPVRVRDILGAHCDDNGAIMLFQIGTDVPLLHEGFFFRDYGSLSDCGMRGLSPGESWPHTPYVRHISGHWYHYSNRSGL